MVTGGAIGWIVCRSFKSQQLDYKALKTIVTSFLGGMGIYFSSSAIIFERKINRTECRKAKDCATDYEFAKTCDMSPKKMYQKSSDSRRKSITFKKEESKLPILDYEISPCKRYIDEVNEVDRKLAHETFKLMERKDFGKKISRDIIQEPNEISRRSEDLIKMLNDLNRRQPKNELQKLPTDNQGETCYKEDIAILKAKVKGEIISCISELKGYVQGTIDPLPSARRIQLRSSEISDEMYRRIVVIVKEYANSMIPKLEQVIDDFIDSVGKSGKVHNDKEYEVTKPLETLGVLGKDLCDPQKMDMNQSNDALENRTKNKSLLTYKNWQQSKNAFTVRLPESISSHSLHEKNAWKEIPELPNSITTKLERPSTAGTPFKFQGVNKPEHRAIEKLKNQISTRPAKLKLSQDQINSLNILKSEL